LYFETNKNVESDLISFDEYIANMRPEQKEIYYLVAPTRDAALTSPYMEFFDKTGVEVLFVFSAIDDFVMGNHKEYEGRPLVSVEKSDIDLSELTKAADSPGQDDDIYQADQELTAEQNVEICNWFRKTFDEQLASCTVTTRLSSSPAIVTDHESGAIRRMMRMVDTTEGARDKMRLPKQHMEINPSHKIIVGIHGLRKTQPALAKVLAEQVIDNCLVAAGLIDDSRSMLPRLNDLLLCVVNGATKEDNSSAFGQELLKKNDSSTESKKEKTEVAAPPQEEKEK
jgi:TNF receptor-associated protein 1